MNKKFRVNSFFGHYYVELTPGSKQADIEAVFTSGNCHSLALALNKLTGWSLCGCFHPDDEDGMPRHVFVQTDEGNFVDITGEKTPNQFMHQWRGQIRPITRKDIDGWIRKWRKTKHGYIPTRVTDSLPYAKNLVNNLVR